MLTSAALTHPNDKSRSLGGLKSANKCPSHSKRHIKYGMSFSIHRKHEFMSKTYVKHIYQLESAFQILSDRSFIKIKSSWFHKSIVVFFRNLLYDRMSVSEMDETLFVELKLEINCAQQNCASFMWFENFSKSYFWKDLNNSQSLQTEILPVLS